jgi:cystathionine beta-lyase/cystathionine gamma-synthase
MPDGPGTRSVHAGESWDPVTGAVVTPLYRSATFRIPPTGADPDPRRAFYSRYGHPNFDAVERKFAALHDAEDAVLFGSGMAAFAGAIFGLAKAGDRIVAVRDLYGGTRLLLDDAAPRFGIRVDIVARDDDAGLARALSGARMLVAESPTNPTLRVLDLARLGDAARRAGAVFVFDNTFATPVLQRPLRLGADLVWESATKALGGHSDLLAGLVAGPKALVEPIRRARRVYGGISDPDAAWLLGRGMKTLAARVERQCRTAGEVAAALERHPAVARVWYPGLESHPDHGVAKRHLTGGYGAVLTIACGGGFDAARRAAERVRVFAHAPSLGGVESLLSLPVLTSHASTPPADRQAFGVTDDLLRLSIGLEDADDLLADLDRAFGTGP